MLSFTENMAVSQAVAIERRNRGFQTASVSVAADLKRRNASRIEGETIAHRDLTANARYCDAIKRAWRFDRDSILQAFQETTNPNMTADDWHFIQKQGL